MTLGTNLGFVTVTPTGARPEGSTIKCQEDAGVLASVAVTLGTSAVGLRIRILPNEPNAQVFVVRENRYTQTAENNEVLIAVPVKWDGDTPRTREKGKDNVDVIILADDGRFVDVQCGIITRKGVFFLTAQRVWEGQTVRTRDEGKVVWDFVPTRGIHAYPGSSYAGVWSTLAEAVLAKAKLHDASEQKSRVKRAEWFPLRSAKPNGGGWMVGTVDYFNLITGTGQIEGEDGVKYFVHFSDIVQENGDKNAVPVLTPQFGVWFRPAKDGVHSRPGIKSVQSLKPLHY